MTTDKKPENPPVFARAYSKTSYDAAKDHFAAQEGMSLRDHFAGLAMQGLVELTIKTNESNLRLAIQAYAIADEMLKQREL